MRAPFGGGGGRGFQATDGSVAVYSGLTPNLAPNLVLNLVHHTSGWTVRKEGMEHEPSNYTAPITLDFQQLMEVRKAITDRLAKYYLATDDDYSYRLDDIATLERTAQMLDSHIDRAVAEWEAKVAQDEASLITDEAVEKWLGDE